MSSIIKLKKSSIGNADPKAGLDSKKNPELNLILGSYNIPSEPAAKAQLTSNSSSSVKLFIKSKLIETKRMLSFRTKKTLTTKNENEKNNEINVEEVTTNNDDSFVSSAVTHIDTNNLKSDSALNGTSSNSSLTSSSLSFLNDSTSNTDNNQHRSKSLNIMKCKICFNKYVDLSETEENDCGKLPISRIYQLNSCQCKFCIDCLNKYIKQCIENCNCLPIHCPDLKCEANGFLSSEEIKLILFNPKCSETKLDFVDSLDQRSVVTNLYKKYQTICENIEILRNPYKFHCPMANCQNVCTVNAENRAEKQAKELTQVTCEKCKYEFCSKCFKKWTLINEEEDIENVDLNNNSSEVGSHANCKCLSRSDINRSHASASIKHERQKLINSTSSLSDFKNIKRCPKCTIPIERAEGCAQIMCKFCRHTFCFYCLESLENDFMLKHYTREGPCKGKLGHSRLSLFFHRISVVGVFAGTILLLVVLSPFILLTIPCLFLSDKCRKNCYQFSTKFGQTN